jgi:endonuclease V-like protein UPF0215 family
VTLHTNKKGIRVFGVAESFTRGDERSRLGGVVMRGDLVIDGVVFGSAKVGGDDALPRILRMYRNLRRNDVNLIMLSGCVISHYNIVDVDELAKKSEVPVICLTYNESRGIGSAIKRNFPDNYRAKLALYRRLGDRYPVRLKTGYKVFVRSSNVAKTDVQRVLDTFTLQGGMPEPVRVAKLLARASS